MTQILLKHPSLDRWNEVILIMQPSGTVCRWIRIPNALTYSIYHDLYKLYVESHRGSAAIKLDGINTEILEYENWQKVFDLLHQWISAYMDAHYTGQSTKVGSTHTFHPAVPGRMTEKQYDRA